MSPHANAFGHCPMLCMALSTRRPQPLSPFQPSMLIHQLTFSLPRSPRRAGPPGLLRRCRTGGWRRRGSFRCRRPRALRLPISPSPAPRMWGRWCSRRLKRWLDSSPVNALRQWPNAASITGDRCSNRGRIDVVCGLRSSTAEPAAFARKLGNDLARAACDAPTTQATVQETEPDAVKARPQWRSSRAGSRPSHS